MDSVGACDSNFLFYFIILLFYFMLDLFYYLYNSNILIMEAAMNVTPNKIVIVSLKGSSFCVAFNANAAFASNPASLLYFI